MELRKLKDITLVKFIEEIIHQSIKEDIENSSNVILILQESKNYYINNRSDPMLADAEVLKILD